MGTLGFELGVAVVGTVLAWCQVEIAALQMTALGTVQERQVSPVIAEA